MKILAILLSLSLTAPAPAGQAGEPAARRPDASGTLSPVVITARRLSKDEVARLKKVRAAGGVAAVSGTGLMIYGALFVGTGPVGWAAGLMFFGGLAAYLAHRRLYGAEDFSPAAAKTGSGAPAP